MPDGIFAGAASFPFQYGRFVNKTNSLSVGAVTYAKILSG